MEELIVSFPAGLSHLLFILDKKHQIVFINKKLRIGKNIKYIKIKA